jgi:hypothetical protein
MGLWALVAAACLCTLVNVTSCGGGGGSTTGTPQQGTGQLPGQQPGNIVGGTGNGNGTGPGNGTGTGSGNGGGGSTAGQPATANWGAGAYTPIAPEGTAGGDAPLGTVPEYNVTEGASTSKESSKTGSLVAGEVDLTFAVTDVTMAANNASPDWNATTATFHEGDPVDLWIKYQIDPNFPLNRTWKCEEIGLDFVEPNVPHSSAGTYTAKLDFTIPWGTTKNGCVFKGGLTHGSDMDESDPFVFNIQSQGTTTRSLYPQVPNYVRNDSQGGGCKPSFVAATFNGTSVYVESAKDLSNVVLKFQDGTVQKWDGLSGLTGTFYGTNTSSAENMAPDAVLNSSSYSNTSVTRLQEDPSSDDTLWATASSNTASPNIRVSFPTPGGTLSTGQASQKIRVLVKKYNSNTGTPTARIDIYENGTLKVTGTTQNITSKTGQVIEQTFNAAGMNKANIEARVVATMGGSSGKQNTVDVGAIQWVADVQNSGQGKTIVGVWIKSGCNASGDGPGYGEYLAPQEQFNTAYAQMAFEDLITGSDYDYNDFVGRINAIETRNQQGNLVQIQFTLKAIARAAGYDSDWQFNINGAFPGASATAIVNQYYATNGTRHGLQKIWRSSNGASVPVFTPIRSALPNPPGSYATNGIAGTQYIEGDYAEVTVIFDSPVAAGSYTPAPYEPELRVQASGGNVYAIGLWRKKGDQVSANGKPLAFIIPDTYAWPLEGKPIDTVYSGFTAWINWINNNGSQPSTNWWDANPVKDYFRRDLFL